MKYEINEIECHRKEKILSLLSNRIEIEEQLYLNLMAQSNFSEEQKKRLGEVLDFAKSQYYGDSPLCRYYVCHPIRVARFVSEWMNHYGETSFELLCASLIHNALEKDIISEESLESDYGHWTNETIKILTVDREKQSDPEWTEKYYEGLQGLNKFGQILKLFDKFDNLYALCLNPDDITRRKYIEEIELYIQPILKKHSPHLEDYFAELIASTKRLGHKSAEHFFPGSD